MRVLRTTSNSGSRTCSGDDSKFGTPREALALFGGSRNAVWREAEASDELLKGRDTMQSVEAWIDVDPDQLANSLLVRFFEVADGGIVIFESNEDKS